MTRKRKHRAEKGLAFFGEEVFEDIAGALFFDAADDFGGVVAGGLGEEARAVFDGSPFGVISRKDDATEARETDGGSAHGAGFERDVEVAIGEAGGVAFFGGCAEDEYFGVGGGVEGGFGLVAGLGEDIAGGRDEDGADGDFAAFGGGFGFFKSYFHVIRHLDLGRFFLYAAAHEKQQDSFCI